MHCLPRILALGRSVVTSPCARYINDVQESALGRLHQIDSFLCSGPELVACSLDISMYQMPFENYFSIYSPFTGRAAERMKCFVEPIFDRFVLVLFVADLEAEERTYYSSLHLLMEMLRRPNPK